MVMVHFLENKTVILSQLRSNVPILNENIKIKGRKATVLKVNQMEENAVQVQVEFEKVKQVQQALKDAKKKKR